ncbi:MULTISPECIES: sensor histidine kinase KdpD [unclassified Thioalkalivibrio]|uniref:sensor histidine kinase n=1 Tax=unclassified Thioalkalivibrio TaxID=2621013 RepID=UPI00036B5045|nr:MULTISPECIES: HAMP domain-containing sensor histidine kinase [unclassified Thioalkalivibrio]
MKSIDFGTVIAISIHDMKNSLGMAMNSLEALRDPETGECNCDEQTIARLQYEAHRVHDSLVQMLTLYRNQQGLYTPRFRPLLVIELLEDYWASSKPLMDHSGVTAEIECDEDLEWVLDRELVTAVLENVVTNTVRYCNARIRLSAAVRDGELWLQVEDDGPGFPEPMLGSRTTEDQAMLERGAGRTGLGLYFCAMIAELHTAPDGTPGSVRLSNDSDLGGGRFTLRLPALPPSETL